MGGLLVMIPLALSLSKGASSPEAGFDRLTPDGKGR